MSQCNVVIYSYYYLFDLKIVECVFKDFFKDCIVVFDEVYNIDNVCIELFSIDIIEEFLWRVIRGVQFLENRINEM